MISWLLDTAPDGAFDVAWDQVPPALRLAHRVWWRGRYERSFGRLARGGQDATILPLTTSVPMAA